MIAHRSLFFIFPFQGVEGGRAQNRARCDCWPVAVLCDSCQSLGGALEHLRRTFRLSHNIPRSSNCGRIRNSTRIGMLYKEKPGFLARMNDVLVIVVDDSIIVNFVDHIWETGSHFGINWKTFLDPFCTSSPHRVLKMRFYRKIWIHSAPPRHTKC